LTVAEDNHDRLGWKAAPVEPSYEAS
jgi:hypothetical protein